MTEQTQSPVVTGPVTETTTPPAPVTDQAAPGAASQPQTKPVYKFSPALETCIAAFVAANAGNPVPPATIEESVREEIAALHEAGKTEAEIIAELTEAARGAKSDQAPPPAPAKPKQTYAGLNQLKGYCE